MLLIDFFSKECCKGTELIEGWYYYDDDDEQIVGGPYEDEDGAIEAAELNSGSKFPYWK